MRRRLEATVAADPETARLLERVVRRELIPPSAATSLLRPRPMTGRPPSPRRRDSRRACWIGFELQEIDGASLGGVTVFSATPADGEPTWLVAKLGRAPSTAGRGPHPRLCRRPPAFGLPRPPSDPHRARGRAQPSPSSRARAGDQRPLCDQRAGRPRRRGGHSPGGLGHLAPDALSFPVASFSARHIAP